MPEEFEEESKNPRWIFHDEAPWKPNWGKPESGPVLPVVTEFEKTVDEYKLAPDQYLQSSQLREWAQHNWKSKFIPETLLKAWGFHDVGFED